LGAEKELAPATALPVRFLLEQPFSVEENVLEVVTSNREGLARGGPMNEFEQAQKLRNIDFAIQHLKLARNALAAADCPKTLAKVRSAIKSAEGAMRHAELQIYR